MRVLFLGSGPLSVKEVCWFLCDGCSSMPGNFFPITILYPISWASPLALKSAPTPAWCLHPPRCPAQLSRPLPSPPWLAKPGRFSSLHLSPGISPSWCDGCALPVIVLVRTDPGTRHGVCARGQSWPTRPAESPQVAAPWQHTLPSPAHTAPVSLSPSHETGSCCHTAPSKAAATGSLRFNVMLENTRHLAEEGQSYFLSQTCQRLAFPVRQNPNYI